MGRRLEEMSLEELWQLFPIFLVKHNDNWERWYEEERASLLALLPDAAVRRLSHIGSTAVPGIWAKNIIDMLLELRDKSSMEEIQGILQKSGWLCMSQEEHRVSMNKGYTPDGFAERVFHLHIRVTGDNDELYFRDFLREHADTAKDYETLKLSLWRVYEHDRDGYTEAKGNFVRKYTKRARDEYGARY